MMAVGKVSSAPSLQGCLFETALRLGDSALILGQQLADWTAKAATLELDIALQNHALDLFGQARMFLSYAGDVEGKGRSEDDLAYFRDPHEFRNCLLAEQPNGDFAQTIIRQFFYALHARDLFEAMTASKDENLAAIAAKAVKEMGYQARHCGEWVVRLGDSTDEAHKRMLCGLEAIWPYSHEMFMADEIDTVMAQAGIMPDLKALHQPWRAGVEAVLTRAGLDIPLDEWRPEGGRQGLHTIRLSYITGEMQMIARADPEAKW